MLPMVLITDNNYFMPTMVALQSVIDNCVKSNLCIHLIGIKLSTENENFLFAFREKIKEEVLINYKTIEFTEFEEFSTGEGQYVSIAALVKFKLPELFPDYDKLLYMDGDIIVRHDLGELDAINIDEYYAAVVKDLMALHVGDHKRLGLQSYFNSGVLLLNCKKMREDGMFTKLIEEKRLNRTLHYMDQDVFNVVFRDKVKYIDVKYNFQAYYRNLIIDNINERLGSNYKTIFDLENETIFLHLAGRNKPWKCAGVNYYDEWLSYYRKLERDRGELKNSTFHIKKRFYKKIYDGDRDIVVMIGKNEVLRRHIDEGIAIFTILGMLKFKKKYWL